MEEITAIDESGARAGQSAVRGKSREHRVRAPLQGRSRETFDRILATTRGLLDGRDFETISVQEICTAASVSPSSFYARFETKEALLFELHQQHRRDRQGKLSRYLTEIDWERLPISDVVRVCLAFYVEDRRRLEPFLRSLMLAELRFEGISDERAMIDQQGVALIGGRLLERIDSDDETLPRRVEFAMRAVCAVAQEAIRPPQSFATQMKISNRNLVDELTVLFCRYVDLPLDDAASAHVARDEHAALLRERHLAVLDELDLG